MKKLFFNSLMCLFAVGNATAQHWSLTWEKMHATGPDLEQIGTLSIRTSQDLGNSPWSVGCETLDRSYAEFSKYKQYVGELGVASARIQSGWARCEQVKGQYDFTWLDEVVDGLLSQHVKPWMCLCYGNPVYGANKGLGSKIFTDKETMQAWKRYVGAVVARYKDRVHEWEVWNEPNLGDNAKYPDAYAELLIRTAEIVRRVQPDAKIIGFGLSRMPVAYLGSVLDQMKKRNKLDLIDYVSFHPYYENPDDARLGIEELAKVVAGYSPRIKLFQGECGCPSTLEWGHALRYYEWSEYSQAKWILRRMVNDWTMGIRSSIFTIVDLQYPNMQQSFGLLRTNLLKEVVYKRPSYHAVQHMVNQLSSGRKSGGWLTYKANTMREIRVAGICDTLGNRRGALVWFSDRIPSSDLTWESVELTIEGLTLKDPVFVELLTGRVYALPKYQGAAVGGQMKFTGLPLWDSPVALVERTDVPFSSPVAGEQAGGSTKDMLY